MCSCQECFQNSALFSQFPSNFLTYELLSYFVCLHCANIYIHLPSFSFLMTSQTSNEAQDETRQCIRSTLMSGPLYPSALNMFEDSLRSNQSHWSLPIC